VVKGTARGKLTGVLIYIKRQTFVAMYLAADIFFFISKGQPPLISIKPIVAFNNRKISFDRSK
jgi:hypothetical protein